jgi:Tn3 transposase DDE domain
LLHRPFAAAQGNDSLLYAIAMIRKLDAGALKKIPDNAPSAFVPKEWRRALRAPTGQLNRNAGETGLALAIKDALRSGDLYLPQSKHPVSFWDLTLSEPRGQEVRPSSCATLHQPPPQEAQAVLTDPFHEATPRAQERFACDDLAEIQDGKLKLKRYAKVAVPAAVTTLQKVMEARLPMMRIEQLLMEVDRLTHLSRHVTPVQGHAARPPQFYRTFLAALISQATNLGVVSMSASVQGITVDMLRRVLQDCIREDPLTAASAAIVHCHHPLPLSALHGTGTLSSSDAQRFGLRASSLLASYYPRYYGYYEQAIGIDTHISDQSAVLSTRVISCK